MSHKHLNAKRKDLNYGLELIQTHMTQKPMLRVEVGALCAPKANNTRGVAGQVRMCKAPVWVGVGILAPAGPLTDFF